MRNWTYYAALWGKFHAIPCYFEQLDRKFLADVIPGGFGEEMGDMFEYITEFGYGGGDLSVVLPKDVLRLFNVQIATCVGTEDSLASVYQFLLWKNSSRRRTGARCCNNMEPTNI